MPVVGASDDELQHVLLALHLLFIQALNIHALVYILSNLQIALRRLQQIYDLLIVDLQEAALDEKLQGRAVGPLVDDGLLGFDALEDVLEGSLHDSSSLV